MPNLRMTENQLLDAQLRKAISGSAGYFQLKPDDQALIAGVKRATWYRRLSCPSDFSVGELRRMIRRYHWNSEIVCAFLGVKEDGSWDI